MMVELTAPHFIGDRVWPARTVLNVDVVTVFMRGLDADSTEAIRNEKVRVFGRWIWNSLRGWHLLDDPPIERPIDLNQPVPTIPGGGPPQ